MNTQREIFSQIATAIIDILPKGEPFHYAVLEIKRLTANIGYSGFYINNNNNNKWLDIFNLNLDTKYIEELYIITQTHLLVHKNWNRAKYTLFPDGKFEVEYTWDEALQNEVDKLNNL